MEVCIDWTEHLRLLSICSTEIQRALNSKNPSHPDVLVKHLLFVSHALVTRLVRDWNTTFDPIRVPRWMNTMAIQFACAFHISCFSRMSTHACTSNMFGLILNWSIVPLGNRAWQVYVLCLAHL